jgi:hypothetical protein
MRLTIDLCESLFFSFYSVLIFRGMCFFGDMCVVWAQFVPDFGHSQISGYAHFFKIKD